MSDICLITGNHPRHKHFAQKLISTGKVCSWVIEQREEIMLQPPNDLKEDLKALFKHHFSERERIEIKVFANSVKAEEEVKTPIYNVNLKNLNTDQTVQFVKKYSPSLVISYGCHKLNEKFIETVGARFWNTHGGLSPEYRGVTTHFWPSYFLEPQMTGITLHETTNFLDAGKIIFQTAAPMVRGDTLHRLAARNVQIFSDQLASKIAKLDFSNIPKGKLQKGYGKVFMYKDWRPEHLRVIYETHKDAIVDLVLNGYIQGRDPELTSVL
tara:strand:+ start:1515 stop:2321 length:807 start_codon:yes stop_codon:yes gene_type:complete